MDTALGFLVAAGSDDALLTQVTKRLTIAGLSLTHEGALILAERRAEALAEVERVEFGTPAISIIADAVADSPCLTQQNVAPTLAKLQEVFYALRDELPVSVSDAQIAEALRGCFDKWGDADDVARLSAEEIMTFSDEYVMALESESSSYCITDNKGKTYVYDPSEWDYDEFAAGWDGEKWSDDWND